MMTKTTLFLLLALLCTAMAALDMESEPKYTVSIYKRRMDLPKIPNAKAVTMTNKRGQRYKCLVPPPKELYSDFVDETDLEASETVEEILKRIGKTCFYRIEGWWTYEFCIGKHIRQFHQDQDAQAEFMLGRTLLQEETSAAAKANNKQAGAGGRKRPKLTHYSQFYGDGQVCDMTGKPRKVEVQFRCDNEKTNSIASISEPATCQYLLTFLSPDLCEHPDFAVKEQPAQTIVCVPVKKGKENKGDDEKDIEGRKEKESEDKVVEKKKSEDKVVEKKEIEETIVEQKSTTVQEEAVPDKPVNSPVKDNPTKDEL